MFNPIKLGIKNADLWMEINADKISEEENKSVLYQIGKEVRL